MTTESLPPTVPNSRTVRQIPWGAPFYWLMAAGRDLKTYPLVGLFYGAAFFAMAVTLHMVFAARPEYVMSIASGCLLVGPFLAMGLYEVSRRRELGLPVSLIGTAVCWRPHIGSMGMLVLVLMVLELLWGRASLVVFAVFFNTGMPSTASVMDAVFSPQNWEFVMVYTVVGGVFAGLVYALSVVAIPMILDRDTDAISAAITSFEVVLTNTGVMLLWGAIIVALVLAALWMPLHVGLLLVGPLLGHASWHAYRATVEWPREDVTVL